MPLLNTWIVLLIAYFDFLANIKIWISFSLFHFTFTSSLFGISINLQITIYAFHTNFHISVFFSHLSLYRSLQTPSGSTTSQKQSTKASGGEKTLSGNLWYHLFGWGACRTSLTRLRFVCLVWCRCHSSNADHVYWIGFYWKIQHTRGYAARMAVWGLQALQWGAVSQFPALFLCIANGKYVSALTLGTLWSILFVTVFDYFANWIELHSKFAVYYIRNVNFIFQLLSNSSSHNILVLLPNCWFLALQAMSHSFIQLFTLERCWAEWYNNVFDWIFLKSNFYLRKV